MTAAEFLSTAWQTVVQTAGYLLAYAFVLLLAPLAHLALLALAPVHRGWLGGRHGVPAAAVAAVTQPLSRQSLEVGLRAVASPAAAVTFLAFSHALAAYSWILLGPLLGKDFLLSHVVGVVLFALFAAAFARGLGVAAAPAPSPERQRAPRRLPAVLGLAALRYLLLAGLGLVLGGLVAAWGFSPWAWALAEVTGGGVPTQAVNGLLGLGLALLGVPPVANLFVGTYLWKVGMAHAGIVAFFCAATASPVRWSLYARVFGASGARRLIASLLAAALLAGLATAWLFGAAGLEIRYKLIPEQLWEVSRGESPASRPPADPSPNISRNSADDQDPENGATDPMSGRRCSHHSLFTRLPAAAGGLLAAVFGTIAVGESEGEMVDNLEAVKRRGDGVARVRVLPPLEDLLGLHLDPAWTR